MTDPGVLAGIDQYFSSYSERIKEITKLAQDLLQKDDKMRVWNVLTKILEESGSESGTTAFGWAAMLAVATIQLATNEEEKL